VVLYVGLHGDMLEGIGRSMKVPKTRDIEKTTWVTNSKASNWIWPDKAIFCQGCPGIITFNEKELRESPRHSTPCKYCGWHPMWPPEPWLAYDGMLEYEA
jgi:hypothetical protein